MSKKPKQTLHFESFQWLNKWKSSQRLLESKTTSQDYPELDEVKEDIERAISFLMGKFPFFGAFVYRFRILYVPANDPHIKTMATDGKNIFINPAFAKSLTDAQTVFVLCHEILHNVMLHFSRERAKGVKKHKRWNRAADYEINPMLVDEGILTAEEVTNKLRGLYDEKYAGKTAEEIYDLIGDKKMPPLPPELQDKIDKAKEEFPDIDPETGEPEEEEDDKEKDQKNQGKSNDKDKKDEEGEEDGEGEGGEESDDDEGGEGEGLGGEGDGKGSGSKKPGTGNESGKGKEKGEAGDEDDDGEGDGIGGIIDPDASIKKQKELGVPIEMPSEKDQKNIIDEAVRNKKELKGGKTAGSGHGYLARAIERFEKPQVNWKNELRRVVGKMVGGSEMYLGKRKHLWKDEYIYGERDLERRLKTAIMTVDTSGSIGDDELRTMLTEVNDIIRSKKIKKSEVVYFDDGIQGIDAVS